MNHIKKCFLLSARALSLEWCERDLVNSISSFSSSSAPRLLMYSEPLSEGPLSIGGASGRLGQKSACRRVEICQCGTSLLL